MQIIAALVTAIIQNLPMIIEAAIKIIGALVEGILGAVGSLISVVPSLFKSLQEELGLITKPDDIYKEFEATHNYEINLRHQGFLFVTPKNIK
jgi:hypothetical protein